MREIYIPKGTDNACKDYTRLCRAIAARVCLCVCVCVVESLYIASVIHETNKGTGIYSLGLCSCFRVQQATVSAI